MNARLIATVAALTMLAGFAGTAVAQTSNTVTLGHVHAYARPGFVHPGHFGYHASTAVEGYLRGRAAVIQSMGRYNYDTSLALINREEARRMYMLNREQAVETRFAMREANIQHRKSLRTPINQERAVRFSQSRMPKRLTEDQLDSASGSINWPVALAGADFAKQREQLESLFVVRSAGANGLNGGMRRDVEQTVRLMRGEMKQRIHDMDPSEYLAVRGFLTSMAYEARFAAEPIEQLASN